MPFERLMELVAALDREDDVTFGELSRRWGEDARRIADAVDAVKVLRGETSYIEVRQAGGPGSARQAVTSRSSRPIPPAAPT